MRTIATRLAVLSVLVVALVLVASCSLVLSEDGIADGARAGGDGGVINPDGGGPDSSASFCASHTATFCADFDQLPVDNGWTLKHVDNGSVDSEAGTLVARTSRLPTANDTSEAAVEKRLATSVPSHVVCSFDVEFDANDSQSGACLARLWIDKDTADYYMLNLMVYGSGTYLSEYGELGGSIHSVSHQLEPMIPPGQWRNVTFDVTYGANPVVTMLIAGQVALDHQTLAPTVTQGAFGFLVGVPFARGPAAAWVARFDNVLCNVQ